MNYSNELIKGFTDRFSPPKAPKRKVGKRCQIKINGDIVAIKGKTIWSRKGYAKAAVKIHMYHFGDLILAEQGVPKVTEQSWGGNTYSFYPHKLSKEACQKFIEDMQTAGILEFVEIDQ